MQKARPETASRGDSGLTRRLAEAPGPLVLSNDVLVSHTFPGAQSSYRAELVALRCARQLAQGPITVGVDCLNLLRNVSRVASGAAADDGKDDEFTALLDLLRRPAHPTVLFKVKAHTKARYGLGDTPEGNVYADRLATRAVNEQRPHVPPPAGLPGTAAAQPALAKIGLVKQSDNKAIKRDAREAFALEHVLKKRETKRARMTDATELSIQQTWQQVAKEVTLRVDVMTTPAKLKGRKARNATMRARSRAHFKGMGLPCPCCGQTVYSIVHWRLGCRGGERFRTAALGWHQRRPPALLTAL